MKTVRPYLLALTVLFLASGSAGIAFPRLHAICQANNWDQTAGCTRRAAGLGVRRDIHRRQHTGAGRSSLSRLSGTVAGYLPVAGIHRRVSPA